MAVREGNLEAPTRHPIDWKSPEYYDEEVTFKELERIFDICHGCRRCVSLCGAFPTLFDLVDEGKSGEVDGVERKDYWKVVDQCYLCDLCYMTKCPYVPPHPWNLDFPHTMLRVKAIRFRYYTAGEGRRLHGFTTKAEMPNKYAMCERQPVGICGLITPFNFPMAIPSWKLIPALVCGNTVVIKSGEDVPLSTINLVKACEEAGIPKGVVNVVNGFGEAGAALVNHEDVRLISFTGSTDTGRIIAEACARNNKIVSLEMGGKNAIIVMDDADIDNAVEGSLWGAFGTSGQRCTASSRLVVHKKVYKKFVEKFVEKVKKLRVGNGLDPKTEVGPVINQAAMDKILSYIEIGQKEDKAKLACGGNRLTKGDYKNGYFIEPTVFTDVKPGMRVEQEEIFGPVTSIVPFSTLDEAIDIVNGVKYGLSSAIYTQDVNQAFYATQELYTGICYVNSATIGAEVHLPFGGTKGTGNGHREAGTQVLDIFTEWKSIYVDYSGKLQKAQIDEVEI